jgi:hypothetical protein
MPLEACRTLLEAFFSFTVFLHMQFCLHLFQQESQDPVQVILWQPHDPWSFILAGSMGILFFSSHAIRGGGALLSFGGHLVSFLDLCMAAGCNENLISVDAAAAADVAQGDGCHHGGLS